MWPCRDLTNTTLRHFTSGRVRSTAFPSRRIYIYIYDPDTSFVFELYRAFVKFLLNLLPLTCWIVTRQRERKKKKKEKKKRRAGRVYEPCIIELHSRCMAAGLMQGSLFPRWPIHSPRDLGACMPCTYQRLLHDRSYYVSKCCVCIVFSFFHRLQARCVCMYTCFNF